MIKKIKNFYKLHKKGIIAGTSLSSMITAFFLGNTYGNNVIDFLACKGDNLPWSITFYSLSAVVLLGGGIWLLIAKVFNFKGKKIARQKDAMELEKLEKDKKVEEKKEIEEIKESSV